MSDTKWLLRQGFVACEQLPTGFSLLVKKLNVDAPNPTLKETAAKRNLPLTIIKLETMEQVQAAPTPATIFSLFYEGKFVTTDISACMDSRFDKAIAGK